ncbi:MAG TPA: hypothetical protein VG320_19850 [Paraburkholderia sp.]|uniref:hypothetical protein n=1 Tax=Paraburkholderia sp. TaxID=1926495 RepID=UPI002DF23E68|nr:hypothetical protein [Paraburkholderia sp.]
MNISVALIERAAQYARNALLKRSASGLHEDSSAIPSPIRRIRNVYFPCAPNERELQKKRLTECFRAAIFDGSQHK